MRAKPSIQMNSGCKKSPTRSDQLPAPRLGKKKTAT